MTTLTALTISAGAALGTLFLAIPARRWASAVGLVDRSAQNEQVVTRGFGIAMLPVALLCLFLASRFDSTTVGTATFAAVLVFALIGAVDDIHPRSSAGRLLAQMVVAVSFALAVSPDLIRGPVAPSIVLCSIGLAGFVNVYNFMDGIDGISVVSGTLGGAWIMYCGLEWGSAEAAALGAVTAGCAIGFAPFNMPVARAFLGDSGSYLFGAMLALGVVHAIDAGAPVLVTVMPFALYVFDVGTTLVIRLARGDALFGRHREFVFHRLAAGSLGHIGTAALVGGLMVALAVLGSVTSGRTLATNAIVLVVVAVVLLGYLALPARLHLERETTLAENRLRHRRSSR